ncbi:hypothetical protein [Rhodoferax sp. TH121]|uniref:hypothetical protein n=1 Tax=Rhodoferax sp. TH121 TaxID=2022803 RepID=UPI0011404C34|nr:hypothetical protein [Rhodoferax sp. TH121]
MAKFTIRVELHDAQAKDYATLEKALAAKNITDVITSDGVKYKMPPAEYQCHGELTAAQVRDIAVAAAESTGKKHAVLVTESASRAWVGLNKV